MHARARCKANTMTTTSGRLDANCFFTVGRGVGHFLRLALTFFALYFFSCETVWHMHCMCRSASHFSESRLPPSKPALLYTVRCEFQKNQNSHHIILNVHHVSKTRYISILIYRNLLARLRSPLAPPAPPVPPTPPPWLFIYILRAISAAEFTADCLSPDTLPPLPCFSSQSLPA